MWNWQKTLLNQGSCASTVPFWRSKYLRKSLLCLMYPKIINCQVLWCHSQVSSLDSLTRDFLLSRSFCFSYSSPCLYLRSLQSRFIIFIIDGWWLFFSLPYKVSIKTTIQTQKSRTISPSPTSSLLASFISLRRLCHGVELGWAQQPSFVWGLVLEIKEAIGLEFECLAALRTLNDRLGECSGWVGALRRSVLEERLQTI